MFGAEPALSMGGGDPLEQGDRLASIEPVRRQRPEGFILISTVLGLLEFRRMGVGRPSQWRSEERIAHRPFHFITVCDVDGDLEPGPDHVACAVAIRRMKAHDARRYAPLINSRLQQMEEGFRIQPDELVLAGIHLSARPLVEARYEASFRTMAKPEFLFTVVVEKCKVQTVRIDRDE